MKLHKRLALVIITITLLVFMSGCIIIPLSKYYVFSAEEVTSVQFYDLRSLDSGNKSGFDKICDPVFTLPEADKKVFLDDFSKIKFSDTIIIMIAAIDPSFSYGDWVVRIDFSNGQYTFYSSAGYGETFDAEGNFVSSTHYSCDDAALEQLISEYYEIP